MKKKNYLIMCWILLLISLSYQPSLACNTVFPQKTVKGAHHALFKDRDSTMLQKRVKRFLGVWLANRNFKEAIRFFSQQAYLNKAMFSESCAGYISDSDRASKKAIHQGVETFLADIQGVPKNKPLRNLLDRKKVAEMASGLKGRVLNDVEADHFLLINAGSKEFDNLTDKPESTDFLKKFLRDKMIKLSVIPRGQGLIIFLWGKENKTWKIFHASLVCM